MSAPSPTARRWYKPQVLRPPRRCADNGNYALRIEQPVRAAGDQSSAQVQNQIRQRSQAIFHVIAEKIQKPHVADQVQPTSVEEHAGKKREPYLARIGIQCQRTLNFHRSEKYILNDLVPPAPQLVAECLVGQCAPGQIHAGKPTIVAATPSAAWTK